VSWSSTEENLADFVVYGSPFVSIAVGALVGRWGKGVVASTLAGFAAGAAIVITAFLTPLSDILGPLVFVFIPGMLFLIGAGAFGWVLGSCFRPREP
jgi:hypothetical protein